MKFSITAVLTFVAAVVATGDSDGCNANNCNRAVTGTQRGPDHTLTASADCSSYMLTTIVPDTTTVTVTTATCKPCHGGGHHYARDEPEPLAPCAETYIPDAIPTYASACDEPGEYFTACSCLGVTPMTTYAPAPTTTVTETKTCCKSHFGGCKYQCMH